MNVVGEAKKKLFFRFLKENGIYEKYVHYAELEEKDYNRRYYPISDKLENYNNPFFFSFFLTKEGYNYWINKSILWNDFIFYEKDKSYSLLKYSIRKTPFRKIKLKYLIKKVKFNKYWDENNEMLFIHFTGALLVLFPIIFLIIVLLLSYLK